MYKNRISVLAKFNENGNTHYVKLTAVEHDETCKVYLNGLEWFDIVMLDNRNFEQLVIDELKNHFGKGLEIIGTCTQKGSA